MHPSAEPRYGRVAQTAHWLTVLLLVGAFGLGFWMTDLAMSPTRLKLYAYHKWIGVTVFALVALRLAWRLVHGAPAYPASMASWERRLAGLTHGLLYLLLFAAPLSGWLMSSAKGFQTVYLGLLPIPDLLGKDKELGQWLEQVHELITCTMLGLVALHLAAVVKHQFLDRDAVLRRMLPRWADPGA